MKVPITYLESAEGSTEIETLASDGLPVRPSGHWIDTKHRLLTFYADIFSTGMRRKWSNRVYLELFAGPGKCLVRDTGKEDLGSPLKVIDYDFTHFIFTEKNIAAAEALQKRLDAFPKAEKCQIFCGDCAEAIEEMTLPNGALTFAFIDPTGIGHAPFSLIQKLRRKTRCDLLINIQHGMGIKMNIHQYTPEASEASALTRFLGHDRWKALPRHDATRFFVGVLDLYKLQLETLGYKFIGREVLISNRQGSGLYLLLFASAHPRGEEFWETSRTGILPPELDLGI